MKPGSA